MMAKRFKLKEGDVFTIPIDNNEFGLGQILYMPSHNHNFIMIVFDKRYKAQEEILINSIEEFKILFLGYTVDAKLYNKDWEIVGNNNSNLSKVKLPVFKLGLPNDDYPDGARLVNYKGDIIGNIGRNIFDKLMYQFEVGPVRFQNALKAYYGLQDWIPEDYDKILYEKTLESVEIAEKILNS